MRKKRNYPLNLHERLFPTIEKKYPYLLHFASLGEAKTLRPLLKLWEEKLDSILFEAVTPVGLEELSNYVDQASVILFPLDYYPVLKRSLKKAGVKRLLLFETELWPGLLTVTAELKIPVTLINGKFSNSTRNMIRKTYFLWSELFRNFKKWYVVDEDNAEFLLSLGIDKSKIEVVPDVKYLSSFNADVVESGEILKNLKKWRGKKKILIMGSMHPGEEDLLDYVPLEEYKVVFVPRHLKDEEFFFNTVKNKGMTPCRITDRLSDKCDVVLVNKYGILEKLYSIADVAVVGGSFIPYGGHNPLEPLNFNVPVLIGKYAFNFAAIVRDIEIAEVGRVIEKDELTSYLSKIDYLFPTKEMKNRISILRGKKQQVISAYKDLLEL